MSATAQWLQPANLRVVATVGSAVVALTVIAIRMRAAKKPASLKKIIIPPLGMSTGFLMFLFPMTHIPWMYALAALLAGFVFSVPLIRSSKFEVKGGAVYLERSRAFVFLLLGLLAIRIGLHSYIEEYVTLPQTGAIFFILAFGMILPWRLAMARRFKTVEQTVRS